MMEIKVNLVIAVPGATMMSEQECSKQLKKPVTNKKGKLVKDKEGNLMYKVKVVPDFAKNTRHEMKVINDEGKKETLVFFTRNSVTATQTINITDEAYEYFISKELPAGFRAPKEFKPYTSTAVMSVPMQAWRKLSPAERLSWHLANIANSLGGQVKSFTIFEE